MIQNSSEERKKFAQEQLQLLKDNGVRGALRLSRIFKAAGPGQIKAAWDLTQQVHKEIERDLLIMLLEGVTDGIPRARAQAVFEDVGHEFPEGLSDDAFFRVLDGALEILVPGAYPFTDQEMEEISDRINRKKYEYEQRQKELG